MLIAGIGRNLLQAKRSYNKKKFIKRTGVKPFVRYVNQNHVMPTRFIVNEFDFAEVKDESLKTKESREALRKTIRERFTEAYRNPKQGEKSSHTKFFFTRLRF